MENRTAAAHSQRRNHIIETLIKNARLLGHDTTTDLRISEGVIAEIGTELASLATDTHVDAEGGTLLPGLHDHHIHMVAFAASLESARCGPPEVEREEQLTALLATLNLQASPAWVRGIDYHPSVASDIDKHWLDRHIPDRPVRIQHRGGRLWILNSRALQKLGIPACDKPPGLELHNGQPTGRLYDEDDWLRTQLRGQFPGLSRASKLLASHGVTGITDTSPSNGHEQWQYFRQSQARGELRQRVRMMGCHQLSGYAGSRQLQAGEFKVHLLESQLPEFDTLCEDIARAHADRRAVAVHCVTHVELVFAISALDTAGIAPGDRIEHASVTAPDQLQRLRDKGLRVITQPHFIRERGDQYLQDVEAEEQPMLYRCASFLENDIPLAAGSDAPFGSADPWLAMRAALERKTGTGISIGKNEALSPEQALSLYLSTPEAPGVDETHLQLGRQADLCLLDSPWMDVREDLRSEHVRTTWIAGERVYDRS